MRIPVVGVAPYLDIQVEDEDSLTDRFDRNQEIGQIDIAVIRVPRISNFTDFNPLESIPGVSLRYVKHASDLKNPDVIMLPGTKNTMEDLQWLRESGMEALILKAAAKGTLVFGICGGYQMLGESLSDPYESRSGRNHERNGASANGYSICGKENQNPGNRKISGYGRGLSASYRCGVYRL